MLLKVLAEDKKKSLKNHCSTLPILPPKQEAPSKHLRMREVFPQRISRQGIRASAVRKLELTGSQARGRQGTGLLSLLGRRI